jgi:GNAT superfamily N-acetyltransferase
MRARGDIAMTDPGLTDLGLTDLAFRRAEAADLPAIVALLADDMLGQGREDASSPPNPHYVAAFRAIDADPHQLQAVATIGDEVVGTLQLTFIPGLARKGAWRGQIEAVRIAAAHRGSGLGQKMFAWAIEQCAARGCRLVQLTTDKGRPDAHRFYERLGFVGSHLGYKLNL